jgi:hypothetical protein
MESSEVTCCGNRVEDDEAGRSENEDERRFKLGELVEFWGGMSVRGYRTDSGEPAWVKADYGGGEYGIKMVGSSRGKFRRVHWAQIYKDGSFNKSQMVKGGARVRTTERLRKIEEGKAEAKFAGKVKEKDQQLKKAETTRQKDQEEADRNVRRLEMKARQSEKDLSACHKRRLKEMGADVEKKRKVVKRVQEELDRVQRSNTRQLERDLQDMEAELGKTKAAKEEQERAVKRGEERLNGLREYGDGWRRKYADQIEKNEPKMEEKIRKLQAEIKERVRKTREVEKEHTLLEGRSSTLEERLEQETKELQANAELRRQVYLLKRCVVPSLTVFCIALHEQARAKGEKQHTASKDLRRALAHALVKAQLSEETTKAACKVG